VIHPPVRPWSRAALDLVREVEGGASARGGVRWRVDWVSPGHDDIPSRGAQAIRLEVRHIMSVPHTSRESNDQVPSYAGTDDGVDTLTPPAPTPPAPPDPEVSSPVRVTRTRTGAAWVALVAAALLAVLLIIFLAQNTRSTEVSFLWMTATTPLSLALLIAAVGSVLLTLMLGTARITQLRRRIRKQRN
jgi:uncharacterized integral membrane protein